MSTEPVAPVYREGESCPICRRAVSAVLRDPPVFVPGRGLVHGTGGAWLYPCRHRVQKVLPPGNRVGFP